MYLRWQNSYIPQHVKDIPEEVNIDWRGEGETSGRLFLREKDQFDGTNLLMKTRESGGEKFSQEEKHHGVLVVFP